MLRLPLTMAAGATAAMDMASGLLMLRLPLTMAAGAMAATAMARGLLMLMPTTAGEATAATAMARGLLMPTTEAGAMEAMDMASALRPRSLLRRLGLWRLWIWQ